MNDRLLAEAQKIIASPNLLVNVVSRRVKQLRAGAKAQVESLERLSLEDVALREIIAGKVTYRLLDKDELLTASE